MGQRNCYDFKLIWNYANYMSIHMCLYSKYYLKYKNKERDSYNK